MVQGDGAQARLPPAQGRRAGRAVPVADELRAARRALTCTTKTAERATAEAARQRRRADTQQARTEALAVAPPSERDRIIDVVVDETLEAAKTEG